jgi:NAD-dependent dihydropyrimidine dehydrogenase PreA subunit
MAELEYLRDVATLSLDPQLCTGCGTCMTVCPHGVFALEGRRAAIVDRDACMECGACALNCPTGAVRVESGVGCASAVITGALRGTGPTCDCSGGACCG